MFVTKALQHGVENTSAYMGDLLLRAILGEIPPKVHIHGQVIYAFDLSLV